jgi:ElaB/YqjD/DUF883 family membrane-anchored ribosome-binding protein
MNRTDPFNDPNRVPEQGTAHVESRITSGATGATVGERASGAASDVANEAENLANRVAGQAQDLYGEARERADEWSDKAGEYADRARSQVSETLQQAEDRLEAQTGAISMIREYPLAAAGVAFGIGFLLAGSSSSSRRRSGMMGRASGQLRSAIVGGVSTMLMQQLQEMVDEHGGPMGLINAMMGGQSGSEPRQPGMQQAPR